LSLVHFETNRYSVPARYAYQQVTLKAYVDRVKIYHSTEQIAEHGRLFGRNEESLQFDHYLDLLERNPGAMSYARALKPSALPPLWLKYLEVLRHTHTRPEKEFIHTLRFLRHIPEQHVTEALRHCVEMGSCGCAVVRSFAGCMTTDAVTDVRIAAYARTLKLPVVTRQYKSVAQDTEAEGRSYLDFLAALLEQEVMQREQNGVHLRIQQARFPYVKTLDAFDFTAIPSLNKAKVLALIHCEWAGQHQNVLLVGNAGTGKTHLGIAPGIATCRAGKLVRFYTAASLVNELIAAQKEGSLHRQERNWRRWDLVVLDELGYIPFSATGSQLLFNFCSERYERGSLLNTSNLEFPRWTDVYDQLELEVLINENSLV